MKFGEKLFQTKLLSRLSHNVCRLRSSPVLLRNFSNIKSENVGLYVESISTLFVVCRRHLAYNASVCIQRLFLVYLDWHDSVENGVRDTRMPKRTTGKRDISFNLDKHHMLHSSAKYPICFVLLSLVSFPIFLYR